MSFDVTAEKAKQTCWCFTPGTRHLAPVQSQRCSNMFDECTAFRARLKSCEDAIKASGGAIDGLVATSDKVLSGSMPGVWEQNAEGMASSVPGSQAGVLQPGTMAKTDGKAMQQAVFDPMASWYKNFDAAKAKMNDLSVAGVRLDAARRQFYVASQKHLRENVAKKDNTHAAMPKEENDPKMTAARSAFNTTEANAVEKLATLCQDAANIQAWISKAMSMQAGTLSRAAAACSAGVAMNKTEKGLGTVQEGAPGNPATASMPTAPQHAAYPPPPTLPSAPQHKVEPKMSQPVASV